MTVTVRAGGSCGSGVSVRSFVTTPPWSDLLVEGAREGHPEDERQQEHKRDEDRPDDERAALRPRAPLSTGSLEHRATARSRARRASRGRTPRPRRSRVSPANRAPAARSATAARAHASACRYSRRQLLEGERRPESLSQLVRHRLELDVQAVVAHGIARLLAEPTIALLPVASRALHVRVHGQRMLDAWSDRRLPAHDKHLDVFAYSSDREATAGRPRRGSGRRARTRAGRGRTPRARAGT